MRKWQIFIYFAPSSTDRGVFAPDKPSHAMFSIIFTAILGTAVGYLLRRFRGLQRINISITLTICLMLFFLGVSVGENRLLMKNFWSFGLQAALIAGLGLAGSVLAAWALERWFFRKEDGNAE